MSESVRIVRIAAGGDGVGRLADGRTVFIPRTAPGDLVEPGNVRLQARFARARLGRLLESGPGRVDPPCRHYEADYCGGCQLQHLDGATQRAARRAIVGDALRRIGRIKVEDPDLEAGGPELGYRAKITLTVIPNGRDAGFHRLGEAGDVFGLTRCEIADEELNRLWAQVRANANSWPPALRQIVLRSGRDRGLHVVFRGSIPPTASLAAVISATVWWERLDGSFRVIGSDSASGDTIPPGVFEQVHPAMGERVRRYALEQLGGVEARHVWDLYAGIGESTAQLAAAGASVESVELDADAVRVAEGRGPLERVRRHVGPVEEWIGRLEPAHAVVTNPPRTGMDRQVVTTLRNTGPEVLVYISCDPATLARDLSGLSDRYRLTSLRAFDLFPQTAHVETVARLERL